jgi:hypothetical protein
MTNSNKSNAKQVFYLALEQKLLLFWKKEEKEWSYKTVMKFLQRITYNLNLTSYG